MRARCHRGCTLPKRPGNGEGPEVVSERLGHATVSITLGTYSHAVRAMQEEAAVRIAELMYAN
jgi:integrase